MERILEDAPRPSARTIAIAYLLYFLTSSVGGFLLKGLVVATDPVATANNILAHQVLYRSGVSLELFANALYVAVTALFYGLFARVNRSVSLAAAFFSVVGCTVQIFAAILQLAPVAFLTDSQLSSAFTVEQLRLAALLSLKLYTQTFHISFVMFGLFMIVLGYLIYTSTFLPRTLGVFWILAGTGSLMFLWPPLATTVWRVTLAFTGLAEIGLMLWLLVKGVDLARWRDRAGLS